MYATAPWDRSRIVGAALALAVQAALLWLLVFGLALPRYMATDDEDLATFATTPPPPPPRASPERRKSHRKQGAAAPRNLRAQATAVVAPPPLIVPPPTAIVAAPVAGTGVQSSQGASDRPGPGTGAGGFGTGTGSGGRGDGDGWGDETPPRWKKGRIKDSDYPRAAAEAGASGTVTVRYRVEIDGRATRCAITRSSGNAELDETTCRLIEQRFRYEPSRDADGRPVISYIVRDNDWIIDRIAPDR
jgi:protein TonB